MNTKIIGIVIAIVAIGGAGAYFMMNKAQVPVGDGTEVTVTDGEQASTGPMSMFDLLGLTGAQKCTFTMAENGIESTVYVAGGKLRTDATVATAGAPVQNVHMVIDGTDSYTWMEGVAQGFKVSLAKAKEQATQAGTPNAQTSDFNKKFDYKCSSWSVDESMFTVPTNIKFMSMGV